MGYTLIELLAVIAIIGILAGVGVGFMRRRGHGLSTAIVQFKDLVRAARQRAKSTRAASRLIIQPAAGEDAGERVRVIMIGSRLATEWNFDSSVQPTRSSSGLLGELVGATVEKGGRHGHALFCDAELRQHGLFAVVAKDSAFDFRKGFSVSFDLWLDKRVRCVPFRLGQSIEIVVDSSGLPKATIAMVGQGDQIGVVLRLGGRSPLPLKSWVRLGLTVDGQRASLAVDSIEQDARPISNDVYYDRQGLLLLSAGDQPVPGRIDSVRIFGYEILSESYLPDFVQFMDGPKTLNFGQNGMLDPRYHSDLPRIRFRLEEDIAPILFDAAGMAR